jgi:hypothetical protein
MILNEVDQGHTAVQNAFTFSTLPNKSIILAKKLGLISPAIQPDTWIQLVSGFQTL